MRLGKRRVEAAFLRRAVGYSRRMRALGRGRGLLFVVAAACGLARLGVACSAPFTAAPSEAGVDDASLDVATVADTSTPVDAGTDAPLDSPLVLADSGSPCASQHLFCEDFDRGPISARWDELAGDSGALGITTTTAVSTPSALEMNVRAGTNGGNGSNVLKKLRLPAQRFRVTFDVRVETTGTVGEVDPMFVELVPGAPDTTFHIFALAYYPDRTNFEQNRGQPDGGNLLEAVAVPLTVGKWQNVTLTFVPGTFSVDVTATVGGTTSPPLSFPRSSYESAYLRFGAPYVGNAQGTAKTFVDNVVVDTF